MAKSATHFGTCQCCGRQQKLPGGRLSKHGYTVEWGFFNGVCPGADALPFEQDKSLAEKQIAAVDAQIASLQAQIDDLKANPVAENGEYWFNIYVKGDWKVKSHYKWQKLPTRFVPRFYSDNAEKIAPDYLRIEREIAPDKWERVDAYGVGKAEVRCYAEYINDSRIKHLARCIDERHRYIDWQRTRCATWAPAELKPIEK